MFGRLRFRVTPETIRVELDGAGVVFEDEAAAALVYDGRSEDIAPIEWGRRALTVPERLHEVVLHDVRKRGACIVPVEEARWFDGERGLGATPASKFDDPWDHHGEIVIVRPWAPGAGSIRLWAWSLHAVHRAVFAGGASPGFGFLRRWWLRHWAPVEVVLPELPAGAKDHDRLVRLLWFIFGRRVRLNGAPTKLREPPPVRWRDFAFAGGLTGFTLWMMVDRLVKGRPAFAPGVVLHGVLSFIVALISWDVALRRDPIAAEAAGGTALNRTSRRHQVEGPDANPSEYAGAGHYRLGVKEHSWWAIFPLLVFCALAIFAVKFLGPYAWYVTTALVIAGIAGIVFCFWLGFLLAATRLSLGERGLTLRLSGWYSRPQRIPYASIRHAAFLVTTTGHRTLRLVLHDGQELAFGFPLDTSRAANEAAQKRLLEIETLITSRLGSPGDYRMSGGSVRGGGNSS